MIDFSYVAYSMCAGLAFGVLVCGILWSIDRTLNWMAD